jgi:hypothetical protein
MACFGCFPGPAFCFLAAHGYVRCLDDSSKRLRRVTHGSACAARPAGKVVKRDFLRTAATK